MKDEFFVPAPSRPLLGVWLKLVDGVYDGAVDYGAQLGRVVQVDDHALEVDEGMANESLLHLVLIGARDVVEKVVQRTDLLRRRLLAPSTAHHLFVGLALEHVQLNAKKR